MVCNEIISKGCFITYNIWFKIGHFWTKCDHFLVFLNTSGTRGFELQVWVWSGLTFLQKLGFGFVGFHFQSSGFQVSRDPCRRVIYQYLYLLGPDVWLLLSACLLVLKFHRQTLFHSTFELGDENSIQPSSRAGQFINVLYYTKVHKIFTPQCWIQRIHIARFDEITKQKVAKN